LVLIIKGNFVLQPNNLLRALRQIKEAAALGLVEGPEEWENSKEKSLAKRIQSFNRFLLEQVLD
jgi:PAB-dependent poly(A)-specific ribonuclease subunit 2